MVIRTYIYVITLSGLNAQKTSSGYKMDGYMSGYKNKTCIYAACRRFTSDLKIHIDWKWVNRKSYSMEIKPKPG